MLRIDLQERGGIDAPFRRVYIVKEKNLEDVERAFDTFFGFRIADASFPWEDLKITFKRDTVQDKGNNEIIDKTLKELLDLDNECWHITVPFIARAFLTQERYEAQSLYRHSRYDPGDDRGTVEASNASFFDFNRSSKSFGWVEKSGKDEDVFMLYNIWDDETIDPKPRELVASGWGIGDDGEAFPRTAYLRDKNKYYQPICNACPRRMLHEMGECQIGDPVCYLQLKHFDANTFVGNYSKYKNLKKTLEDTDD